MPIAAEGSEPDQLMALKVAADALEDAGYRGEQRPPERTAVILGRAITLGLGDSPGATSHCGQLVHSSPIGTRH